RGTRCLRRRAVDRRGHARRHRTRHGRGARRRRPDGPHDARPRAARTVSRRDRQGHDARRRRADRGERARRVAALGRPSAARTVAREARVRCGVGACARARQRQHRDTALASRGQMALLYTSDPNGESVAPFGGLTPVFTPNPFAAGIPTSGDPILIDISASYTTNGLTQRLHAQHAKLPHPWLQDAQGQASDDPAVLFNAPKGTLLPLGGHDAGHKGFALALLVEALTAGLAGVGRADPKDGWGATVFVQVIEPAAFGGADAMRRQMDHLVAACHASTPRDPASPVRLPGERGLALARDQRANGVALYP